MELKYYLINRPRITGFGTWRWNWYVVLPKWHKYYWLDYNEIPVDVHWWLTFWEYATNIYNLPIDINNDDYVVWFDTAHWNDNLELWSRDAVLQETINLKNQLELE